MRSRRTTSTPRSGPSSSRRTTTWIRRSGSSPWTAREASHWSPRSSRRDGTGVKNDVQQLLNGVFVGSIYALFAVGYTLVFGVLDILNLAHQAVFMLSAFAALALVADAHVPLYAALPLAMLAGGVLGAVLERLAFRPLRGRADSNISGLISSLAMATIFEAIAAQLFGPDISRFPFGTFPERMIEVGSASASLLQLCI